MRLTRDVYVVGSGYFGFNLSGPLDCHVYVIDGGSELALIDAGLGAKGNLDTILDNMREDGLDPKAIRKIILTHYHTDHIGGGCEAQHRLDAGGVASPS